MYKAVPTEESCAKAWVAACKALIASCDEGYNIVIDVADPLAHSREDNMVISLVDKFLKTHDSYPIITVANTIFPQSLLDAHGPTHFYDVYHRDFASFSNTRQWGRYFERMTRHIDKGGTLTNPLQELITKLKGNEEKGTRLKAAYEIAANPNDCDVSIDEKSPDAGDMTIYQPSRDRNRRIGGPCLSYLSFKRHSDDGLLLTAIYRNHYYIMRLLGNLIGLGRLQAFVAAQAGIPRGSLTVVSTHAELDARPWGIAEARELVSQSASILESPV